MVRTFDEIAKSEFIFLEKEFTFELLKCKKEDWGYELVYESDFLRVKIVYEFREAYLFISFVRLAKNNCADTELEGNWYSLDDIIVYKKPEDLMKPAYEYGEDSEFYDPETGLLKYVSRFSDNLRLYGKEVLEGDFSIIPYLDEIVEKRNL